MSSTFRRTIRGIEITITVNSDWSGEAAVWMVWPTGRTGRATIDGHLLLTGWAPPHLPVPLHVWGAVVSMAVETYLLGRVIAAVEDVRMPEVGVEA